MCSIEIISAEVVMTYISRKTRLLVPHFVDECDPGYLYHLNRKRSDGRLKRHSSCDDLRAWVDDEYLNYQYLLELMNDGEERPFLGLMGRFIPVEAILDILCGKVTEGGDGFEELGKGGERIAGLKPRRDEAALFDTTMSEKTDDLLRLAEAAMAKLEAIRCIVCGNYEEVRRESDVSTTEKELKMVSQERTERSPTYLSNYADTEEYTAEYNSTLLKIACLRERLHAIQQCRDEVNEKLQSSCQTKCQSSSGMTVTELYNREEQSNTNRLQKKVEKLIAERGQVLREMCSRLKYLNELKKNTGTGSKLNKCPCSCPRSEETCNMSSRLGNQQGEDFATGTLQEKERDSKTPASNASVQKGHYQESKLKCQKCAPYPVHDTMSVNRDTSRGSSEATFVSLETLPVCDSQRTYNAAKELIPAKKFKSESSMTEVELTLRSYEQRLSELGGLETEIEKLKKGAAMAEYFKKRWLRTTMRGRNQRRDEEEMKREMEKLQKENCELKKVIQTLAIKSEKDHKEMQRLRCKAMKIVGMEEEMIKLKDEISSYQLSCESQNECIGRLEDTIREQRDEINRLMTHMTRLCRMAEKLREVRKANKKKIPRSRSYSPECQNIARGHKISMVSPDDEIQRSPCCLCNRNCNEALHRPQSECGRRMPERCFESSPRQPTCRNQSRYD